VHYEKSSKVEWIESAFFPISQNPLVEKPKVYIRGYWGMWNSRVHDRVELVLPSCMRIDFDPATVPEPADAMFTARKTQRRIGP
jgi:hypothetical protein